MSIDPLIDLSRDSATTANLHNRNDDPMWIESCAPQAAPRICYSPEGGGEEAPSSPVYRPVSSLWAGESAQDHAALETVQPQIMFGPGIQLSDNTNSSEGEQVQNISELVTRMEIDSVDEMETAAPGSGCTDGLEPTLERSEDEAEVEMEAAGFDDPAAWSLFRALPDPVLGTPPPPPQRQPPPRQSRLRKTMASTRSSLRLAARPSTVPVDQRAQEKLMKELSFINSQPPAPDAAVTNYIDMYGADLPEEAIKAIRAATRMGNKELAKVLAAMAEEAAAVDVEVQ